MGNAGKIDIFSTLEIVTFPSTKELIETYNTIRVEKYYSGKVLDLGLPGESYDDILKRIDYRIFISHIEEIKIDSRKGVVEKVFSDPSHFVYLIRVSYCGDAMYKIGITNNIKPRMGTLKSEGYNPKVIAYLSTPEPRKIEKELHDRLIEFHHSFTYQNNYPKWSRGFFDFDNEQLERVIGIIKSYNPERFTRL